MMAPFFFFLQTENMGRTCINITTPHRYKSRKPTVGEVGETFPPPHSQFFNFYVSGSGAGISKMEAGIGKN